MFFLEILKAVEALFGFLGKALPSDKIRETSQEINKPLLEEKERIRIYDIAYRRLKNHPEIVIENDVNFVNSNLHDDDKKWLIENLTARIHEYRRAHPVIFRKWLKANP